MESNLQAAILAAIFASGLTGYINYRLLKKKSDEDNKLSEIINLRTKREVLLKNLYVLSLKLSFSKLEMADGKNALEYHNTNYDYAHELISEIKMISSLYFEELKEQVERIDIEANRYWGHYKDYLKSKNKDHTDPESDFQLTLSVSLSCGELISDLRKQISAIQNA